MPISYTTFIKHATHVTRNADGGRPALRGIYHHDRNLIVTDGHRLYKAENVYTGVNDAIIDPVTGEAVEGKYPETDRLIPKESKVEFTLKNISALTKVAKGFQEIARIPDNLQYDKFKNKTQVNLKVFVNDDGNVVLSPLEKRLVEAYVQIAKAPQDQAFQVAFNAEYFFRALDLFRDAGYEAATFKFYGELRPFIIENGDLLALILPVRVRHD